MAGSTLRYLVRGAHATTGNRRAANHSNRRLRFEALEDRRVLATFTVSNLGDAPVTGAGTAPGTLRQAIYDANDLPGADLIEFAPGLSGDVELSTMDDTTVGQSALRVSSEITIRGNTNGITISRSASAVEMRLIFVTEDGNLSLETISLTGGIVRGEDATTPGEEGGIGQGGAVLNQGKLAILASTIYANQAIGGNGGAGARGGAGLGGAIYSNQGTLAITNSTFSGNAVHSGATSTTSNASSFGGAIYAYDGSLTVHNSTITLSTASSGRGIYVLAEGTATIDIRSSIIGESGFLPAQIREFLATDGPQGQLIVTGSDNLIRSQIGFPYITISTDDPLLGNLANNGGPTQTHAITAASPAVDLGSNSQNLAADQRGGTYSRVTGAAADIGAYELQAAVSPALLGDYNGNGAVDAADYVLWRKTYGIAVPQYSGADGSGNSIVDDADYGVWRGNFGSTLPPAGAAALSVQDVSLATVAQKVSADGAAFEAFGSLPDVSEAIVSTPASRGSGGGRYRTSRAAPVINDDVHDRALLSIVAARAGATGGSSVVSFDETSTGEPPVGMNCDLFDYFAEGRGSPWHPLAE